MFKTIKRVDETIIPKLREHMRQLPSSKVVIVKNVNDWNHVFNL